MLDLTLLEELADGDTAQLDEFLALFLASAEASIAALRDGAHAGDLAGVERAAHKLKSSARTIGACHLGDLCAAAEVVAARRDATALDNLLPNIIGEFTTIRAALAAHLRC